VPRGPRIADLSLRTGAHEQEASCKVGLRALLLRIGLVHECCWRSIRLAHGLTTASLKSLLLLRCFDHREFSWPERWPQLATSAEARVLYLSE
jgi:hypothetical protein